MISVIVVNHNGGDHLRRCLASVDGGGDELEVLVVDNASSDGSLEMVEREFPSVRTLPQSANLGFGRANNLGAVAALGDPLLLLNCDAWLDGDCLGLLRSALGEDPGLAVVVPSLAYPDGRAQFSWAPDRSVLGEAIQRLRNRFEGARWNHRQLRRLLQVALGPGWCSAACALVRRSAFEAVDGFDEGFFMYFEDADLCLRLRAAGWRLLVVDQARATHVGGGSPATGEGMLHYRQAQLRYYRTHRPRWESRWLVAHLRRKYRTGPVARWLRCDEVGP